MTTTQCQKKLLTDPEEAEPLVDAADVASNSDASDGRPLPGVRRVWARISHVECLHRSTFEDWRVTFASLLGRRDRAREDDNVQARHHSLARARVPFSSRAGSGTDYRDNVGLSYLGDNCYL